jgi:hypothetical protein
VLRGLILLLASLAMPLAVAAQPVPARPAAIHDCASFTSWFKRQPGFRLTVEGAVESGFAGPAPRSGSDEFAIATAVVTHFRGNVGGGGCLGGYYDAAQRLAAIQWLYDTSEEAVATIAHDPPDGLRSGMVDVVTLNGVRLGMSATEVEHIEGPTRWVRDHDDLVLRYSWVRKYSSLSTVTTVYYGLSFLLVGDHVVAMDFYNGA